MKLIISLVLPLFLAQNCEDLHSRNEELQESIHSLESQLRVLSPEASLILQDLEKNKNTLHHLVQDFQSTPSLYTAEKINQALHMISIDLSLLSDPEEQLSRSSVDQLIESLTKSIYRARLLKEHKEFSRLYNQLLKKIDEKDEQIKDLNKENGVLSEKLKITKGALVNVKSNLKSEKELRANAESELENVKNFTSEQIEGLETDLAAAQEQIQVLENKDFKGIQDSQNALIQELQRQNGELTLKLEQAQTDLSALANSLSLDKSSCESVKSELDTRSEQFLACETNFEQFRRKVELENIDQIQVLKDSEASLQIDIRDLQIERSNLLESFNNCTRDFTEKELEDTLKENIIKGLRNDLEHAENSVESAKSARGQEVEILQQGVKNLKNAMASLQLQYDEAIDRILQQSEKINELEAKVQDFEYVSQRNLRG